MSIPGLSGTGWRTSSHSSGNGACVQVTTTPGSIIAVRDSKPTGPRLVLSQQNMGSLHQPREKRRRQPFLNGPRPTSKGAVRTARK